MVKRWDAGRLVSVSLAAFGAVGLLALLQTHSPVAARGRVISTFFAIYGGVQAVGMLLAGLVGAGTGLTVALQLQGTLYLVAAGLALRLTRSAARDGNGRIADWASGAHGRIVRGRAR